MTSGWERALEGRGRPVKALGSHAGLVLTPGPAQAQALAAAVRAAQLTAVIDVVPAAASVGILLDPTAGIEAAPAALSAAAEMAAAPQEPAKGLVEVDVYFDGRT